MFLGCFLLRLFVSSLFFLFFFFFVLFFFFFFQAEDGIRDRDVTGVQTCALPISGRFPSLRGTVVSAETAQPLGFSIVSLRPGLGQQFTDTAGTFTFGIAKDRKSVV